MGSGKKRLLLMVLLVWAATCELVWCWGDAKEHLNIATNWAQDKFAGGGVNKESTESVKDKASGAAAAASGTSKYASDKADQVGGQMLSPNKRDNNNGGRSLEEQGGSSSDTDLDDWKNSYEDAMKKMGEHYNSAKDSISEHSKNTYEAAKDHTQSTYEAAKDHTQSTYEAARDMAHDAAARIN